ncbi:uncharacterized protein [Penaeus vannamei]|uniref:uncharacterized protein n=1 Tax=Penaeus vannamei TaxID=6689 RepID=UPI00387F923A
MTIQTILLSRIHVPVLETPIMYFIGAVLSISSNMRYPSSRQVSSTPLIPTPSQHTPPSIPLPLEYSHESPLSQQCPFPDPSHSDLPDTSSPSPVPFSHLPDYSPHTFPIATSVFHEQSSFPESNYSGLLTPDSPLIMSLTTITTPPPRHFL